MAKKYHIHGKIPTRTQPDWNQNDIEASDYVKNRPFYTEDPAKTVIFEEEKVTIGSDLYVECAKTLRPEIDRTYYVKFNGTEYECIAWKDENYYNTPCIGNGAFVNVVGRGNEEPFLIEGLPENAEAIVGSGTYLNTGEPGEYTISISTMVELVHQLDIKYIPGDDAKMNVKNPVCTGEFSMNRSRDSAVGSFSSTLGAYCEAPGMYSHAEGLVTIATGKCSHAQGSYNIEDTENKYLHIVGNGGIKNGGRLHSNAHTLDWEGNAWYQGDVYVGSTAGVNRDEGSKKLATEEYVNNSIPVPPNEFDAIALAIETGLIEPVSDENGNIYIDENSAVYTL